MKHRVLLAVLLTGALLAAACSAGNPAPSAPAADAGNQEKWRPLFNGKDLAGWVGDTQNYYVEDGVLVCPKSGQKLFTEEEFADFRLRFEFLLTPNANNGIGIRSPLVAALKPGKPANPAYEGMEIQIMDDYGDKNQEWKPYQLHGSIYGVVAPKTGFLKPVGEWNTQEIVAKGTRIQVILNGEKIVDADVGKFAASETPDGKPHPGLTNKKGHISILGHKTEVRFRNIRIMENPE